MEQSQLNLLLDSPENFERFIADIRERREQTRLRRRREYWERASELLATELEQACADGDDALAGDIETALRTFRAALAGEADAKLPESRESDECAALDEAVAAAVAAPSSEAPAPPPCRDPASLERLHTEVQDLLESAEQEIATPDPALCRDFALKALYCRAEKLLRCGPDEDDRAALADIRDRVEFASGAEQSAFPYSCGDPGSSVWSDLARGYALCARAEPALGWYERNHADLGPNYRANLMNAIAAAQSLLYRRQAALCPIEFGVQRLYSRIRAQNDSAGWIRGIDPATSDDELIAMADTLSDALRIAQEDVADQSARRVAVERKNAAVAAVAEWKQDRNDSGADPASDMALPALLAECLEAGVPPTNAKLREILLDCDIRLIAAEPKCGKILDAVLKERKRRGLDGDASAESECVGDAGLEPLDDSDPVASFARGKRLMLLGGKSRPKVCSDLAARLGCDVVWPDSEKTDHIAHFEYRIRQTDVLLLVKKLASHELFQKGREIVEESGGQFVVLPSGYGVAQILNQLAEHVSRAAH